MSLTFSDLLEYKYKLEELTFPTKGCWWFQGEIVRGRGVMRIKRKNKHVATMSWELSHGELVPEGMVVKATCENSLCVNPKHLFLNRKTYPWRA